MAVGAGRFAVVLAVAVAVVTETHRAHVPSYVFAAVAPAYDGSGAKRFWGEEYEGV
ncbi:hypothetical protein GCM10010319_07630 [Streptomyces blastmyceticus]|uniref:Uncharacterized protein n=1 Tax=Streptomyces blastmyceticus TaxID=68180 RepID=A0ABP3G2Z2_9ACTN